MFVIHIHVYVPYDPTHRVDAVVTITLSLSLTLSLPPPPLPLSPSGHLYASYESTGLSNLCWCNNHCRKFGTSVGKSCMVFH